MTLKAEPERRRWKSPILVGNEKEFSEISYKQWWTAKAVTWESPRGSQKFTFREHEVTVPKAGG